MTNKRFIKTALLTTGVLSLVAAGVALVRVRAQIATIQPFVAIMIEEMAPRKDQPPTPVTRFQTIAVRSDGSISRVTRWEARAPTKFLYWREVIDATAKIHVQVEDQSNTIIKDRYSDVQMLANGVQCEGSPASQLNGFEVTYSEHAMGTDSDSSVTHRQWQAPQLGCYPIVQQWIGQLHGQSLDTKQTLASIKIGEPDPWYFAVPPNYTARTNKEWMEWAKPLLKQ